MFNWQDNDPWAGFEPVQVPQQQSAPQPLIQRPRTAPLPARDPLSIASEQQQMAARAQAMAAQAQGMGTEALRQQNLGLDIEHNRVRNERQALGTPLPRGEGDALRETAGVYRALRNANNNFRPEYSGLLAGVENRLGALNTDWADQGQREWWAEFQRSDIGERNQLFGATLTPSENSAFAGTTIATQMDPDAIRENVGRRYEAARASLMRQRDFLIANGYRREAVDALIGEDVLAEFNVTGAAPGRQGNGAPQQQQQRMQAGPAPSITDRSSVHAAPGSTPQTELANGATRLERDPALRGVNSRIGNMMVRGASDQQIREYVGQLGLGDETRASLEQALEFRRDRRRWGLWRRQNPNAAYPVEIEMREVPMSGTRQFMSNALDSRGGAAVTSYGNMLTGQRLDEVVGSLGGDQEMARAGIDQLRQENPYSSFAGDVAGAMSMVAGGNAALGRAGIQAGRGGLARILGGEAAMGAYQGQGLNREAPLTGAATGGALGLGGGAVMRGATGLGARAVAPTGGRLAPLYAEGAQPSIGQRMGGVANRAEEAFASFPGLGAAQRGTRQRANDQVERGVFNRALRNIPPERSQNGAAPQLPREVEAGAQAWQHSYRAFDDAYNSVHSQMSFRLDNRVQQSLVQAQRSGARLSTDSAGRFERILADDVMRPIQQNGGTLNGRQLQEVLSNLRQTMRNVRNNPNGDTEFVGALEGLEASLIRGATRYSPREAIRDLRRIDRGYAQLMRAERAALRGTANREPGRFSANDLMRAERQYGDRRRFLRGDQEGAQYAAAWQQLGRAVPDSGTPERLGYMAAGGGMFGGSGAAGMAFDPLLASPLIANTLANLPGIRNGVNWALDPGRAGPNARHIRDLMLRNRHIPGGTGAGVAPNLFLGDPY